MKLCIIKTLFIPDSTFINVNINSIKSFRKLIEQNKHIIFFVVGWVSKNIKDYDFTIKLLKSLKDINIIFLNNNCGKINTIKTINVNNFDYVLYADHDISIIDNLLNNIKILNQTINNNKIAIISPRQIPDNRHNSSIFNKFITIDNVKCFYSDNNINIASGCFITTPYIFNLITQKHNNTTYGNEDILIGSILNKYNYINVVTNNYVLHPFNNNKLYNSWKLNKIKHHIL